MYRIIGKCAICGDNIYEGQSYIYKHGFYLCHSCGNLSDDNLLLKAIKIIEELREEIEYLKEEV